VTVQLEIKGPRDFFENSKGYPEFQPAAEQYGFQQPKLCELCYDHHSLQHRVLMEPS